MCDTPWESDQHLRAHLKAKLQKSEEARKLQKSLLEAGGVLAAHAVRVAGLLAPVQKLAESQKDTSFSQLLLAWKADLDGVRVSLQSVEGIREHRSRTVDDWLATPKAFAKKLKELAAKVEAQPDQTATLDAQTFLTTAQTRLGDYREAMRKHKAAEIALNTAKEAYKTYCDVLEEELNTLYSEVEKDFSAFYRAINGDDEATFTAKLTPSEGSLGLDVNFYERGLFPPGAYHSEGHQDGMGVCLYLALMKRLFGKQFTFALLDDVVMSVDAGHRYEFCKLLRTHFPETQFVITTHDRLWAEQMRSAGLVTSKTSVVFHSWTIDSGPLVESNLAIWEEIAAALAKGKVEAAAAALRHHLEYVSRLMADQIGATPAIQGRRQLRARRADAERTEPHEGSVRQGHRRRPLLGKHHRQGGCGQPKSPCCPHPAAPTNVERWAVNKAVHYNEWANFGKKDFEPVVTAFKELLGCFSCEKCESWFYVTPRGANPDSLRCACNAVNLNLKAKPK